MACITSDQGGKEFWQTNFDGQALEVGLDEFTEKIQAHLSTLNQLPPDGTSTGHLLKYLIKVDPARQRINQQEFNLFLRRFGPFEKCLKKASQSFFKNDRLQPWFHGTISRDQAISFVTNAPSGSFLVRFSERHPTKFTLTYKKPDGLLRNTLLHNLPEGGVGVDEGHNIFESYASVAAFVNQHASLLTHPIESSLYRESVAGTRQAQDRAPPLPNPSVGNRNAGPQVNRYVSGQGSYQRGFNANSYIPSEHNNYSPAGFPSNAATANYSALGFGDVLQGHTAGAEGHGYGAAGFENTGRTAGAGGYGYGAAGFDSPGRTAGAGGYGYGAAGFETTGRTAGAGGYGYGAVGFETTAGESYSAAGFTQNAGGAYSAAGFAAPPSQIRRFSQDFEMPPVNPGMGPYTPAFMTNSSDSKGPDLDDLPPPPMMNLVLQRNSSRGLSGDYKSRSHSIHSAKEKFDRARKLLVTAPSLNMELVPEDGPPSPDANNQEALVLLDEVLNATQGKEDWHYQQLHCEALLMQQQLFTILDNKDKAFEALQKCLTALEEAEDHQIEKCASPRTPKTAELVQIQKNCLKEINNLRFLTHEHLKNIYIQQEDLQNVIKSFEGLVGSADNDSARSKCRENLREVLGDDGMAQFSQPEFDRVLAEAAKCFKSNELPEAVEKFTQAVGVARLGNLPNPEARALCNLGTVHKKLKNSTWAIRYYQQSLELFVKLGDENKKKYLLNALSICCMEAGRYTCAKKHCNDLRLITFDTKSIGIIQKRLAEIDDLMAENTT